MLIYANAKINLALEVLDIKNGYHMVNNIMMPIDLYDEIDISRSDKIEIEDDPFPGNNLVEKAAKLFFEYTKIAGGVKIKIKKNIPSASGLAGGSSDAMATLIGLNTMYQTELSKDVLLELASKLGSDVGFFINQEPALCTGRGDIIDPINSTMDDFDILLIKPNGELSTKEVYSNYVPKNGINSSKVDNIIEALKENDLEALKENVFNELTDSALSLSKEMNYIYNLLKNNNLNPHVSGSGPSMFIIDPKEEEIDRVYELLKNQECLIMKIKTI